MRYTKNGYENLIGNALFFQSGGPTSVFNATFHGFISACFKNRKQVKNVYVARYGLKGILEDNLVLIKKDDFKKMDILKSIPGSYFGSARYKLADEKDNDYSKILEIIKKYNIRFLFVNGGNDSMDTCSKLSNFFKNNNYKINVIGISKTVDNDLNKLYLTPGYLSCAKYVINTIKNLSYDFLTYDLKQVNIIEVMGRNAGYIAMSSILSNPSPDFIYTPEIDFDLDKFLEDVKKILDKKKSVLVVVSEGIKTKDGVYVSELFSSTLGKDVFGNKSLGGVSQILSSYIKKELKIKSRAIDLSLMQRASASFQSQFDLKYAKDVSYKALEYALLGYSDYMVGLGDNLLYNLIPLSDCANKERCIPDDYFNNNKLDYKKVYDYFLKIYKTSKKLKKDLDI